MNINNLDSTQKLIFKLNPNNTISCNDNNQFVLRFHKYRHFNKNTYIDNDIIIDDNQYQHALPGTIFVDNLEMRDFYKKIWHYVFGYGRNFNKTFTRFEDYNNIIDDVVLGNTNEIIFSCDINHDLIFVIKGIKII